VITGPVVWSKDFTGLEQDGCRDGARWLQGWSKMVAGLEQDGCRAGARWLRGWSKMVAGLEQDGCRAGTTWLQGWSKSVLGLEQESYRTGAGALARARVFQILSKGVLQGWIKIVTHLQGWSKRVIDCNKRVAGLKQECYWNGTRVLLGWIKRVAGAGARLLLGLS
jgi:hypothetical protein